MTSDNKTSAAGGHQQRTESHSEAQHSAPSVSDSPQGHKHDQQHEPVPARGKPRSGPRPVLVPDFDEVRRALTVLLEPGQVTELRALGAIEPDYQRPHPVSGYFDDPEALVRALERLDAAEGIYVVLNPVEPALLARANNRTTAGGKGKSTGDHHILRRRWLPVDFDPERPSGISSTDVEHQAALERARQVREVLSALGWPDPVLADSGNGAHLLYRIELPADDGGLVGRVLEGLAFRFSDSRVKVDVATANPARIWKLYGTHARKGDNIPTRPHRLARMLEVPEELTTVSNEQLHEVAGWLPQLSESQGTGPGANASAEVRTSGGLDVGQWLADQGLEADGPYPWQGGQKWVLRLCPWNPDHTNGSAFVIQFPNGAIAAGCHHTSCKPHSWHTLRALFEHDPATTTDTTPGVTPWQSVRSDRTESRPRRERPWPKPLHEAAFHGLAGRIVRALEPETEADPAALLISLLAAVGNLVGTDPHWTVGDRPHGLRIWPVMVGRTSKGRKGTAWATIQPLLRAADSEWHAQSVKSGLSSGEGLIWHVRDPVYKMEPVREGGKRTGPILDYEEVMEDPGVTDKRLLVIEEEFAKVLKVMTRDGNIISDVMRQAWDDGVLRVLVKNSPVAATGAHVTVVGHITEQELIRYLNDTEAGNGFANRFLWVCVRRARLLPEGGRVDPSILKELGRELTQVVDAARQIGRLERDEETTTLWHRLYGALSDDQPGLLGAITSRAEAQVMRLAAIYAVLDRSPHIRPAHLRAAVAVWDYLEASVRYIFGDALGDPVADTILAALVRNGSLSRTQIRDLFKRNQPVHRIENALQALEASGRAVRTSRQTGGRPEECWQLANTDFGRNGRFGRHSSENTASEHGYLPLILPGHVDTVSSGDPNDENDKTAPADDPDANDDFWDPAFDLDFGTGTPVPSGRAGSETNTVFCRICGGPFGTESGPDSGLCERCHRKDAA